MGAPPVAFCVSGAFRIPNVYAATGTRPVAVLRLRGGTPSPTRFREASIDEPSVPTTRLVLSTLSRPAPGRSGLRVRRGRHHAAPAPLHPLHHRERPGGRSGRSPGAHPRRRRRDAGPHRCPHRLQLFRGLSGPRHGRPDGNGHAPRAVRPLPKAVVSLLRWPGHRATHVAHHPRPPLPDRAIPSRPGGRGHQHRQADRRDGHPAGHQPPPGVGAAGLPARDRRVRPALQQAGARRPPREPGADRRRERPGGGQPGGHPGGAVLCQRGGGTGKVRPGQSPLPREPHAHLPDRGRVLPGHRGVRPTPHRGGGGVWRSGHHRRLAGAGRSHHLSPLHREPHPAPPGVCPHHPAVPGGDHGVRALYGDHGDRAGYRGSPGGPGSPRPAGRHHVRSRGISLPRSPRRRAARRLPAHRGGRPRGAGGLLGGR